MITVIKSTGEQEPFSEEKILASIKRARIPQSLQSQVAAHVKEIIYDKIPTSEIYSHITEFLARSPEPFTKSKYGLKQAIMQLGPTGYPFEDFIAKVMETQGYTTQVRTIVRGTCISHEIDVIAIKGKEKIMIEAKFHNLAGIKTDVQVALYTKARYDDIKDHNGFTQGWIITNTNATIDAIAYANCRGMNVISWDYPHNTSFRSMIENSGLFPITTLTALPMAGKQKLLEQRIVLCKDIYKTPSLLNMLNLSEDQKKTVLAEAEFVCKID